VELLVALALSGIVVSVLFQVIAAQGRFVERQSSREEVQQNARAALELIGGELRTIPGGDALVRAAGDSLTIRVPRVWGVVCALPGGDVLDIALPARAQVSTSTNLGTGLVVNVGAANAPIWSSAVAVTAIGAAAISCNGADLGWGAERRRLTLAGTPQSGATTPTIGNIVYLFDQVTYRAGTSGSSPGRWIQRRVGDGSAANQPMAGPIADDASGLGFEYFADNSEAPLPTPITDAGIRGSVTRVGVRVGAVSRNRSRGSGESRADTVIVALRNRR